MKWEDLENIQGEAKRCGYSKQWEGGNMTDVDMSKEALREYGRRGEDRRRGG